MSSHVKVVRSDMLEPGDLFLDEFEILCTLGEGGFATVFRARQRRLGRDVAIKLLRLDDDLARKRFIQEAQLISRLCAPSTVTMHDFGEVDGQHYMILEYVSGVTLRSLIDRHGALDPPRVVRILSQIVSALVEAHAHGILHRDIKPENIMVYDHYDDVDRVKVLDFGIAKLLSPDLYATDAGPTTTSGKTIGTPRYMAPELLAGEPVTDAADLFSLGMIAYEMLTGVRAVSSTSGVVIVARILDSTPFVLPENSRTPPALAELVNAMLVKAADQRLSTAREASTALRALPAFAPATEIMSPEALAAMHSDAQSADVDDEAPTVSDMPIARSQVQTARYPTQEYEPHAPASTDVEVAIQRLKEDAVVRRGDEIAAQPDPRSAKPEPIQLDGPVPVPKRRGPTYAEDRQEQDAKPLGARVRAALAYGSLVVAILFAVGFLLGVVGVKTTISEGHPLDCGLGSPTSMVIEHHFEILGKQLLEVGREVRCFNSK